MGAFQKVKRAEAVSNHLSTYSDGGQQPFRHVSHNDADEEDDSLQPAVTQDDGQDEECDSQKDGHTCDDMDEMLDLFGDGGLAGLQAGGQSSDATHDRAVSSADNDATCCAWFGERRPSVAVLISAINAFSHFK